ncbi:MAG: O-antigen ligase family protein [Chitinophagaceae bacterium]|nr:O-antigen ligase family protein [Chitinophagaceae bacterium]
MPNPDPTLTFGILVLVLIVLQILISKAISTLFLQTTVLLFFIFHFLILVSLFYTPSEYYASIKVSKIFFNLIAFIAPIILFRRNKDFDFFITFTKSVGVIVIVYLCYQYFLNELSIYKVREDDIGLYPEYMSVSYFLGTLIIVYILSFNRLFKIIPLILLALFLMLQLAAKGPILFLVISILLVNRKLIITWIKINTFKSFFYFSFCLVILFIGYFTGMYEQLTNRLLFVDGVENDQSSIQRVFFALGAFNIFINFPFLGGGIGSFGILHLGSDVRASAHNIILEVLSELGIVGFSLLILFFVFLNNYRKSSNNTNEIKNKLIINTLLLYNIFQSMVASYLEDSRILYFFIGLSLSYYHLSIKSIITKY